MIGFISILMLVNILAVGYFAGHSLLLVFVKYYRRFRRFLDPNYMRTQIVQPPQEARLEPVLAV
jgi:hypothetical protein